MLHSIIKANSVLAYSDEDDVSGLDCDVSASADSDADISLCQSRRVVNTVANHRHSLTTGLQLTDLRHLV